MDKKRDWQGSFTHEEAWGSEGCDKQAFLSNARTHTQTNVLATEFILTILFAFICHGAKNTCRDHGRGTVDSSRTAEHAWTPCFCLTPVGIVTLLHYEWWKQGFSPWGIDRLIWRSDSLDDITSHRVPWVFSASICISKAFAFRIFNTFPHPSHTLYSLSHFTDTTQHTQSSSFALVHFSTAVIHSCSPPSFPRTLIPVKVAGKLEAADALLQPKLTNYQSAMWWY